ncbi:MAG: TetR/AcrR family transcriptional regulator [Clostridiales bacterium]|nr:TetR/AcrR family transcriptional regulator [Clostridiales bacterium]
MAKQIKGVSDRLLAFAQAEFLQKGFLDASLRTIAENAGTSTGSIYTRFGDKNGLFSAIVGPVAEGFLAAYREEIDAFNEGEPKPVEQMLRHTAGRLNMTADAIYDHLDEFKLLICRSEGSGYENFLHRLAQIEAEQTERYLRWIGSDAMESGRLSPALLHMLSSAFWAGVFQTVEHDMSKEEALVYIAQLKRFYRHGWQDILQPGPDC